MKQHIRFSLVTLAIASLAGSAGGVDLRRIISAGTRAARKIAPTIKKLSRYPSMLPWL